MKKKKLILDVDEKPTFSRGLILSIQHVFAMFGATILVPALVNAGVGQQVLSPAVALFTSGVGTLIYILCTKEKSPVYLGSSFAFITPMIIAHSKGGVPAIMTGIMAVGLVYVIVSYIIKIAGKDWLTKLLPPIIIGPMIMIIGLGLAPAAISQIGITSDSTLEWKGLIVALVTFLTTAIITIKGKGFIKIIPFFIGIVSGYVAAIILGMVDFRLVAEAPFFGVPNLIIPFKDYTPVASGLLIIIPVAIVTIAEHIGDHTVLGEIIGKDLIKDPGLDRTLMGDGLATFIAGLVGGPANTTYGENTGVVGMTKVASIIVIIGAAIISIILAFFAKFTAIVSTIPGQVLGGVSLLLYGFIAINGLKVLIKNKIDFDKPKNIIIASSMLVLGLGGAALSFVSGDFSLTISGMSLACIVGIVINLLINEDEKAK
ncbi:MAG: solute carrier family 23 protein [Bacilli bacterium]|nr:solute carrier family 23 protein [Bacilli bacterium]